MPYGDPDPHKHGYIWSDAVGWHRSSYCCIGEPLVLKPFVLQSEGETVSDLVLSGGSPVQEEKS